MAGGRGQHVAHVVGRVRADHHLPTSPGGPGGGDGLGDQARRAGVGDHVPPAQPGPDDHRRGRGCAEGCELDVQAPDLGVPEPRGLLGIAVHGADGVVHVDEDHALAGAPTGQQARDLPGQARQDAGGDLVELLDVTVGERPQERAHGRGRPHPRHEAGHAARAQQVQVIDAVRTGQHPRDHGPRLGDRVRARHAQMLDQQAIQTGPLAQLQHGHQPGGRHKVRIIEDRRDAVAGFHLRDALREPLGWDVALHILAAQKGILTLRHAPSPAPTRWIRAQSGGLSTQDMLCDTQSTVVEA